MSASNSLEWALRTGFGTQRRFMVQDLGRNILRMWRVSDMWRGHIVSVYRTLHSKCWKLIFARPDLRFVDERPQDYLIKSRKQCPLPISPSFLRHFHRTTVISRITPKKEASSFTSSSKRSSLRSPPLRPGGSEHHHRPMSLG